MIESKQRMNVSVRYDGYYKIAIELCGTVVSGDALSSCEDSIYGIDTPKISTFLLSSVPM